MPILKAIKAVTQALDGNQADWDDVTIPIPDRLLILAMDTGVVKMGDGVTLYADLPVLFNVHDIITVMESLPNKADQTALDALRQSIAEKNYLLSGREAPAAEVGELGNYYLQTQPPALYGPKTETGWGMGVGLGGGGPTGTVVTDVQLRPDGQFEVTLSTGETRLAGSIDAYLGTTQAFITGFETALAG